MTNFSFNIPHLSPSHSRFKIIQCEPHGVLPLGLRMYVMSVRVSAHHVRVCYILATYPRPRHTGVNEPPRRRTNCCSCCCRCYEHRHCRDDAENMSELACAEGGHVGDGGAGAADGAGTERMHARVCGDVGTPGDAINVYSKTTTPTPMLPSLSPSHHRHTAYRIVLRFVYTTRRPLRPFPVPSLGRAEIRCS